MDYAFADRWKSQTSDAGCPTLFCQTSDATDLLYSFFNNRLILLSSFFGLVIGA